MKQILITGGAGFIGSAFVRYVLNKYDDVNVVIVDNLTYAGNWDNLKDIDKSRFLFLQHNIMFDDLILKTAISGCYAIVNFAAETHVDRSLRGSNEFISTNVIGVNNLLKLAKEYKTERILLVSTDEIYGSAHSYVFDETDKPNPSNPYAASKMSGELFGRAYFMTYNLPVMITRGTNTYGPRQYPEKVLPLFITNAIDDKPLPMYGNGENVRDWLHVDDHCSAIDLVLHQGKPGETYNIAGNNRLSNIELTKRILKHLNKDENLIKYVTDRVGHDYRYAIRCDKINKLGWSPSVPFDVGLKDTVDWYVNNEWWWRKIKNSSFFKTYYETQYCLSDKS